MDTNICILVKFGVPVIIFVECHVRSKILVWKDIKTLELMKFTVLLVLAIFTLNEKNSRELL